MARTPKRTRIEYAAYEALSDEGPWLCHLFYPAGCWDEDKLTLEEAERKYPKDQYEWIDISDEEGFA